MFSRYAFTFSSFLSTPSARRATASRRLPLRHKGISIHALREEGDRLSDAQLARLYKFLSTPSARRATSTPTLRTALQAYFYPRPPRGGRPHVWSWKSISVVDFYPRPPRGGRPRLCSLLDTLAKFLSTPSARRATQAGTSPPPNFSHFYPRPPRGGRPCAQLAFAGF